MDYLNKLTKKNGKELGCGTLILVIVIALALAFGLTCLYAWVAMVLWNWVMPMIWTSAPVMTFWPMWGIDGVVFDFV